MGEETPKLPDKIPVNHQAGVGHRVFRADGVTTSITPQSELQAAFYQTVMPLPTDTFHAVKPDGTLADAPTLPGKPEIIRQVEATIILNPLIIIQIIRSWQQLLNVLKETGNETVRAAIEKAETSTV